MYLHQDLGSDLLVKSKLSILYGVHKNEYVGSRYAGFVHCVWIRKWIPIPDSLKPEICLTVWNPILDHYYFEFMIHFTHSAVK